MAYHFRSNSSYDPVTGKWWNAGWYDTFIFIPGYNWTPVYGWEPIHLSDDGRWLILRKYPEKPRVLAVLPYMENQRNIVWWKCDFNRNGKLDQSDFSIIQTNLSLVGPAITDLNGDGVTDEEDMSIFHRNYKSQNP